MIQTPDAALRLAERLLRSGAKVPEIEQALVGQGVDSATASYIVDAVLQSKLADPSAKRSGRSFSWVKVLLSLGIAGIAFVGIYVCLVNAPDGVLLGLGAWRGAIRGGIIGCGAGLAIGALNVVRSELMLLMRAED